MTGANKGIGLEICRQLASNGVEVILTARDEQRGIEAVENLRQSGVSNFVFHQLDVKDSASAFIETHFGKLDILVTDLMFQYGISAGIIFSGNCKMLFSLLRR